MKIFLSSLLAAGFIFQLTARATTSDGTSPPEVITRLTANAHKVPPGPVENDVTSQTVSTCTAVRALTQDTRPVREVLAGIYNDFTLEGPFTSDYADSSAAIYSCKAKLSPDELAECKDEATSTDTLTVNGKPVETSTGSGPGFGDGGGFSQFVGAKVPDDGHVIASFCLVLQHGLWKVHGVYFSAAPLAGADKKFIVSHLTAFAKKA